MQGLDSSVLASLLPLLFLLTDAAHAGVWIREPGHPYLQVSAAYQTGSRTWDEQATLRGNADPVYIDHLAPLFESSRYQGLELGAYAEVGVVQGLELVASLPWRAAQNEWEWTNGPQEPVQHRNRGFGDGTLGVRGGVKVEPVALSLLVAVRVPFYDNSPAALNIEAGNSDFYDDRVPLGPGTTDLDILPGVGTGLGVLEGWALFEGGLRIRNRQFGPQLPARLQVGVRPVHPWALWLEGSGLTTVGSGQAPDFFIDAFGKGPIALDNTHFAQLGLGTQIALPGGFAIGATGERVLWGRRFPALTRAGVHIAWTGPTEDAP